MLATFRRPLPEQPNGLTRFLCRLLAAFGSRRVVALRGAEHVAPERDPFVLVANHSQRLEAVLLPALLDLGAARPAGAFPGRLADVPGAAGRPALPPRRGDPGGRQKRPAGGAQPAAAAFRRPRAGPRARSRGPAAGPQHRRFPGRHDEPRSRAGCCAAGPAPPAWRSPPGCRWCRSASPSPAITAAGSDRRRRSDGHRDRRAARRRRPAARRRRRLFTSRFSSGSPP